MMPAWQKGQSGNPKGRPKGSYNSTTLVAMQLLESKAKLLVDKAFEMAMEGNQVALKLCIERLVPVRREALVIKQERPVASLKNLSDGQLAALRDITQTMRDAEMAAALAETEEDGDDDEQDE